MSFLASVLTASRAARVLVAESGPLRAPLRSQPPDAASGPVVPDGGASPRRRDRVVLLALTGPQQGSVFTFLPPIAAVGREEGVAVQLRDDSVSARHAIITHGPGSAWVEDLGSRNGTFVNDQRVVTRQALLDGDHLRFGSGTLVRFWMMDQLEEHALRTLFALTLRDPLTRLYNRRYFDERLLSEFHFARRHRTELALVLIDVDHFKSINDDRGHQMGDTVLRLVAGSIERVVRPEDVVARFGGDEFAIIARAISERNAEIFAARICRRIEALTAQPPNHLLQITISAGVALMTGASSIAGAEDLVTAADDALYRAKAAGRNQVIAYSVPPGALHPSTPPSRRTEPPKP